MTARSSLAYTKPSLQYYGPVLRCPKKDSTVNMSLSLKPPSNNKCRDSCTTPGVKFYILIAVFV